jgi:lysophospholipase L1-like esterase
MARTFWTRLHSLFAAALLLTVVLFAAQAATTDRRTLVFGDSISWGWIPTEKGFPTERYQDAERWPTIMAEALGPGYRVSVNAVSGRTTDVDYAEGLGTLSGADFNGLKALPDAIAAEMPLDLVIVFLGTNDLRTDVGRTPREIAVGAMRVAALAAKSTGVLTTYAPPRVLVIVPPPDRKHLEDPDPGTDGRRAGKVARIVLRLCRGGGKCRHSAL